MMHDVCQKCMTAEERQIHDQNMENLDQNMEDLKKRFQTTPWLSGLVKRSASASECSPGNSWECIGNNCKCYDGKSKRSTSAGDNVDSGDNSLPSAREIIDSTKDKIRKDFEKNPLLSGLVKRSAASDSCSAESAGCSPGTEPASINNVCKCLTPEQLKNVLNSAMDGVVQKFEKNSLLSGLVKRSASEFCSAESAGCAPGTQPA